MQLPRHGWPPLSFFRSSSPSHVRGQLTVEWLMLLLLVISLLAIASFAISNAATAQTNLADRDMLRMELEEMGHYADEICVMGVGNARVVELAPVAFNLSYDDSSHNLTISKGNFEYSRTLLCPMRLDDTSGYGEKAYLQYAEMGDSDADDPPGASISSEPG